jgi:ribosome recycling factor
VIIVKPYDPGTLKDIERGLQNSDLGITPNSDGKLIRLPVPPLSGERRNQLAGQVKKMAEAQRVAVRNARRDANKLIDSEKKDSKMTEDEAERCKERVQDLTKKYEGLIDSLLEAKTKEIQEV